MDCNGDGMLVSTRFGAGRPVTVESECPGCDACNMAMFLPIEPVYDE